MLDAAAPPEHSGEHAVAAAEIERQRELARDVVQPVEQPLGGFHEQEIRLLGLSREGAVAPSRQQGTVEDLRGFRHRWTAGTRRRIVAGLVAHIPTMAAQYAQLRRGL